MAIKGILSEYSLAEIFKILEQGNKTGQLVLTPKINQSAENSKNYYIWFRQGRIVGASDSNDHLGLINLIEQRNWLSKGIVTATIAECSIDIPLGFYLKSKNLLQAEQLKMLFYIQVMQQICNLFQLAEAQFQFEDHYPLPMAEMTGLSSPGTEVTLIGLRALKDWSILEEKLPDTFSSLISNVEGEPYLNLNQVESQVWQYCNKQISLKNIAQETQIPLNKIQQIAFRLMAVNLAEELPMVAFSESKGYAKPPVVRSVEEEKSSFKSPSKSFLKNLVNFLQNKT